MRSSIDFFMNFFKIKLKGLNLLVIKTKTSLYEAIRRNMVFTISLAFVGINFYTAVGWTTTLGSIISLFMLVVMRFHLLVVLIRYPKVRYWWIAALPQGRRFKRNIVFMSKNVKWIFLFLAFMWSLIIGDGLFSVFSFSRLVTVLSLVVIEWYSITDLLIEGWSPSWIDVRDFGHQVRQNEMIRCGGGSSKPSAGPVIAGQLAASGITATATVVAGTASKNKLQDKEYHDARVDIQDERASKADQKLNAAIESGDVAKIEEAHKEALWRRADHLCSVATRDQALSGTDTKPVQEEKSEKAAHVCRDARKYLEDFAVFQGQKSIPGLPEKPKPDPRNDDGNSKDPGQVDGNSSFAEQPSQQKPEKISEASSNIIEEMLGELP